MKIIYISGPFRGANSWEIEKNIRLAEEASLEVWKNGMVALCPHMNTRFFQGTLPDNIWLDGDLELVKRCDALLMVGTWLKSGGAKAERDLALSMNIPVYYSLEELINESH